MKKTLTSPSVLRYLDLSAYLKDYYQYRKSCAEGFSYDKWIQELEISLSRVFLRLSVLGIKKVPHKFVDAFAQKCLMTSQEKEYFRFLVKHSQAATQEDRQLYAQKLIQILRSDFKYTVVETNELKLSPLFLRMLTLLSFKDVQYTSENISFLLDITIHETNATLQQMEKLQLIELDSKAAPPSWRACNTKNEVKPQPGDHNLMAFHEKSLLDAIKAFHQPKHLRRYHSMLFALSDEELVEFHSSLDNFIADQCVRFDSDYYEGKRLFQVNLNIHSVAKPAADIENATVL